MIFTSLKFLVFAALTLAGYFVLPKKLRWAWITALSVYFYLCAGLKYGVFLLISTLTVWLCGLFLKKGRWVLILTLTVNLGLLAVLKYAAFAVTNLNLLPFVSLPVPAFAAPLGVSFYTFLSVSYVTDVYREVAQPQRNPFKLLLWLSFFPHVTQGPIDRWGALAPQLFEGHSFDYDRCASGLRRALWGFFEKLVIADRLGMLVDPIFAAPNSYGGGKVALAIVAYAIQIYADFAGYMDIACGLCEVMGIRLGENFDAPYFSASVPEFWRRWHMTLGSFFRDYLFYPVLRSGWMQRLKKRVSKRKNRKKADKLATVIALALVWTATGVWHGSAWHYIAWGMYYGVLIIASELIRFKRSLPRPLQVLRTFLLVLFGYVLFRADNLARAWEILARLPQLGFGGEQLGLDKKDLLVALAGTAILLLHDVLRVRGRRPGELVSNLPLPLRWVLVYACVLSVVIFGVYGPDYNAASFLYFAF